MWRSAPSDRKVSGAAGGLSAAGGCWMLLEAVGGCFVQLRAASTQLSTVDAQTSVKQVPEDTLS